MSLGFTQFSGSLVLESDLHTGNGDFDKNRAIFSRDAQGRPVIPGSTLKGALRARLDRETAELLFGTAKGDGTGTMGQVIFYAARLRLDDACLSDLPAGGNGLAVASHVAIDRTHGGAENQKLFELEIVPAGAQFDFDAVALGVPKDAMNNMRKALAPLATGLALGRGASKGNGRLRLKGPNVRTVRRRLVCSGDAPEVVDDPPLELPIHADAPTGTDRQFTLHCPGPYLSHDPCASESTDNKNVQFSLRRNSTTPILWPESLYGVLRRRCAWIARTDNIEDGDNRFRVLSDRESPLTLARTERLFGVAGWRGLIRLGDVALVDGKRISADGEGIAGIALDRFSGAVLDGRLFFADAWTGLMLTFALGLDTDRCHSERDSDLFGALVDEIQEEGLQLGHGTNRGFGWFECEKVKS